MGTEHRDLRRTLRRLKLPAYLYVAPALILMLVFKYWPMFFTFVLSAMKWNFMSPSKEFIGLRNFTSLFQKEEFWQSFVNTFRYILLIVPVQIVIPLALALLLFAVYKSRFRVVYQAVIFMPTVLSFAIVCMVWLWMFHPTFGVLNQILNFFGLRKVSWLSEPAFALPAISFVTNWKLIGYNFLIFYAAITSIPSEYVEAATIDGASSWSVFWRIKLPLLSPTTFFVFVTTVIYASDRVFIPINMLTRGGPYDSTSNLIFSIYRYAFQFFNVGVASATATVTFLLFVIITYLQLRYLQKQVHYDS